MNEWMRERLHKATFRINHDIGSHQHHRIHRRCRHLQTNDVIILCWHQLRRMHSPGDWRISCRDLLSTWNSRSDIMHARRKLALKFKSSPFNNADDHNAPSHRRRRHHQQQHHHHHHTTTIIIIVVVVIIVIVIIIINNDDRRLTTVADVAEEICHGRDLNPSRPRLREFLIA